MSLTKMSCTCRIPPRVQQRQRVREALPRPPRNVKPHIVGRFGQQVLEVRAR